MIGIVDYGAGNVTSVMRALSHLGIPCFISNNPLSLARASHLIFPGVGAAGNAMGNLRRMNLDTFIIDWVTQGKPLLGICLGTQIIFEYSEENETRCLGLVEGCVKRFPTHLKDEKILKIPHMGWNSVIFLREHPVFAGLPGGCQFYFVHSFYPAPDREDVVVGVTDYGISFCSALARNNIVAVQFHPEKSGRLGLMVLDNFFHWRDTHAL